MINSEGVGVDCQDKGLVYKNDQFWTKLKHRPAPADIFKYASCRAIITIISRHKLEAIWAIKDKYFE